MECDVFTKNRYRRLEGKAAGKFLVLSPICFRRSLRGRSMSRGSLLTIDRGSPVIFW